MFWNAFDTTASKHPEAASVFAAIRRAIEDAGDAPVLNADDLADVLSLRMDEVTGVLEQLTSDGVLKRTAGTRCKHCGANVGEVPAFPFTCPECRGEVEDAQGLRVHEGYEPAIALVARDRTAARIERLEKTVRIAIVTALSKEGAAVLAVMDDPIRVVKGDGTSQVVYEVGTMPAIHGQHAVVHLCLHSDTGNNPAAAAVGRLLRDFPGIRLVVVSGIAGGCPNVAKIEEHVRLGDIVISGQGGVFQYDNIKKEPSRTIERAPPRPPSKELLDAHGRLEQGRLAGKKPWLDVRVKSLAHLLGGSEPLEDILDDGNDTHPRPSPHPTDPNRSLGEPRIFVGTIGSSNILLKDPQIRDRLRDDHGVRAIEMESSGVAQAVWQANRSYFVVKSIVDYCNERKGDAWHLIACANAAAYVHALLAETPLLV